MKLDIYNPTNRPKDIEVYLDDMRLDNVVSFDITMDVNSATKIRLELTNVQVNMHDKTRVESHFAEVFIVVP